MKNNTMNTPVAIPVTKLLPFEGHPYKVFDNSVNKRRAIINIFVHSIYLYDDHFTLIVNANKKPLHIDNIPLEDIEAAFEGENGTKEECSSMNTPVPSNVYWVNTSFFSGGFAVKTIL